MITGGTKARNGHIIQYSIKHNASKTSKPLLASKIHPYLHYYIIEFNNIYPNQSISFDTSNPMQVLSAVSPSSNPVIYVAVC